MIGNSLFRRLLVLGVALASLAILNVQSASAHQVGPSGTDKYRCGSGELCIYIDTHYDGGVYPFVGSDYNWDGGSCCSGLNDEDSSSWRRKTSGVSSIWQHDNLTGARIACLPYGGAISHHDPNDVGSSHSYYVC